MDNERAGSGIAGDDKDERFSRIEQIYHQALERPEEERPAFLAKTCAGDEDLREEVEKLLSFDRKAGSFMESPALDVAAQALARNAERGKSVDFMGQTLLHYKVIEKVGEGGMGVVYKAFDTRLKRPVAVKVLPPERVTDPERRLRFIQEARAASALNHPNIVHVYDIDQAGGTDFIAMEYVPGKPLDELIPRKGMRLGDTLKYAIQIADALAAAHAAGIVHRDLKPANVMITEKGLVKVLDFGLAKLIEPVESDEFRTTETLQPRTEEGIILGTVSYMSPEQAEGKKVDARSDIFSFGSLLYEMVTGHRAFEADSRISTLSAILHQQPEPVGAITKGIPTELEKLIERCLRKDPELRIQHVGDVKLLLAELKEELDAGRVQVILAAEKRASPLRIAAVIVAVVVIIAAGWYWLGRQRPTEPEAPLTTVPLTSYPGYENSPSFSPDGMHVAFQWCTEGEGKNCDIYIKQVGVEPPVPLTNAAADDFSPSWSPDGLSIAFCRKLEPTKVALIVIPQRGGRERQLVTSDISNMAQPLSGPYLAWTPDSKWLALAYLERKQRVYTLSLISVDTGEQLPLTTVPRDSGSMLSGDTCPAFSPDGRTLAFIRDIVTRKDLYLLRLGHGYRPLGEPERVETGNSVNRSPCWTPDGREIVFSSGRSYIDSFGLWRMGLQDRKPVRLGFAQDNARSPSIARSGRRLVYMIERIDWDIWRVDLQGQGRKSGSPFRFISSTRYDGGPAFSPDGRRIAFISLRSGNFEVWICDSDGSNQTQLTSFGGAFVWGLSWSPDGKSVGFWGNQEGNFDVYVVNAGGGTPRRMTTNRANEEFPFWSADGRWLYFNSNRTGRHEIWRMPSEGGEEIQITRTQGGASAGQISPDGRFLYYQRGWPVVSGSVWRMPVGGGEETMVLDSVNQAGPSWQITRDGIYYLSMPNDSGLQDLYFLESATGRTTKILEDRRSGEGGIAVSPDGQTILYLQEEDVGSDLMLVENFR